jgi:UDP-N-acetylglucosamine acyltransferase
MAPPLVHPTVVVSDGVELGDGVVIGPHAVILGPCRIGADTRIGAGCVVGTPPEIADVRQNDAWNGDLDHHGVEIGPGSVLRELVTVQQGSTGPTRIGAGCWLLSRAYVAHDCLLGDGVTLSAGTSLGGYAVVGDHATLGMNVAVHQRRRIGPGAMVGMSAVVTRDVPPWAKSYGAPARTKGANVVGLRRRGVPDGEVADLDREYAGGPVAEGLAHPLLLAARAAH